MKEETISIAQSEDSFHPAKIMGENLQEELIDQDEGFQYTWMFCIRGKRVNSAGWLIRFFNTQIWLAIIKILIYVAMSIGWFTGKFNLFHHTDKKSNDIVVIIFLVLVSLMWIGVFLISLNTVSVLKNKEKERKASIIFATKSILYTNIFACLVNLTMTILEGVISWERFQEGDKVNGEFRMFVAIGFGAVTFLLLGQSYMFWHAEEPLADFSRTNDSRVSYDLNTSDD